MAMLRVTCGSELRFCPPVEVKLDDIRRKMMEK